jgi:hypothetical protein
LYPQLYTNVSETVNEFKAHNGWLTNFRKRRNLVLRRIATKGREAPKNATGIIKKLLQDCQNMINLDNYTPNEINMDETSMYLDLPSNYTFTVKGVKKVKCTTTGNERTRISAAFSATASGQKLSILLVVPRVKPDFTPLDDVIVVYKTGGTFNDDRICKYIDSVVSVYMRIDRSYNR